MPKNHYCEINLSVYNSQVEEIRPVLTSFIDGAPMVQRLDAMATKPLFEDDGFKKTAVPKRKSILFNKVSKVLKDAFPAAYGFGDEERGNHG